MDRDICSQFDFGNKIHSLITSPSLPRVSTPSLPFALGKSNAMGYNLVHGLNYVQYEPNKVAYLNLSPNRSGLSISDAFTGCAMALFEYNGIRYAAHIALDGNAGGVRAEWNRFINVERSHITRYVIFRPFVEGTDLVSYYMRNLSRLRHGAVGIIEPSGRCYSALYDNTPASALDYFEEVTANGRIRETMNLSAQPNVTPFYIPPQGTRGW